MAILDFLKSNKNKEESTGPESNCDRGILLFENTGEVIQAETVLKQEGWTIRVMGPPRKCGRGVIWLSSFPSSNSWTS